MWKTETVPLDEKTLVWIKRKIDTTTNGQIVINIKDKKAISIHYLSNEYFVDIDSESRQ